MKNEIQELTQTELLGQHFAVYGTPEEPLFLAKDGFSFLVMGYTGAKAAQFKEMFIAEFNRREALLL